MRRVRQFIVRLSTEQSSKKLQFDSWHALCLAVAEELRGEDAKATIYDARNRRRTIAEISRKNRQISPEPGDRKSPQWRSELLDARRPGPVWYVNCNATDFQWELLEGARREVPFRLSFAERRAQRSPDGLWAYGLGMLEAWRDRLLTRC